MPSQLRQAALLLITKASDLPILIDKQLMSWLLF